MGTLKSTTASEEGGYAHTSALARAGELEGLVLVPKSETPEDYSDITVVKPGWFESFDFYAPKGSKIEVSAWETDSEDFSLYLLRSDDIGNDTFRTERAFIRAEKVSNIEETHVFTYDCEASVLISNIHAVTHDKEIHLRVSWLEYPSERKESDAKPKKTLKKAADEAVVAGPDSYDLRTILLSFLLVLLILSPLLIGLAIFTMSGDIVVLTITGILTAALGTVARFFESEIRSVLGLGRK